MTLKVRQKTWGEVVTESVADALRRKIGEAGYDGGQMERLQAELDATQEILLNLVAILEDSLTKEDVIRLVGSYGIEVVDE